MRAILVSVAFLGTLLGGCISAESSEPSAKQADAPAGPDVEVDPNSEFGVVAGTVISDETQPLEGAQVGLAKTDLQTTTDVNGAFAIRDVPPGEYSLIAGRLGYEAIGRNIQVAAGQATQVTLTLTSIQVDDLAFVEVIPFTGFFDCALGTNVWISACSWPYTAAWGTAKNNGVNLSQYGAPMDIQKNIHRFNFSVKKDIGQLVSELTWQSASAAATRMLLMTMCGDYDYVNDECTGRIRYGPGNGVVGTNPIKAVIDGSEFLSKGKGKDKYDLTKHDSIWAMSYVGLPFGNPQVAFQQKFEVWDSVFYNGVAPDDYTVLPDQ